MIFALDYDKTYNAAKDFWDVFIELSLQSGHKVYLVTARGPVQDRLSEEQWNWPQEEVPVIYCNGVAKRWCLKMHHNLDIDVWIDDKPDNILSNSTATHEVLEEWRNSEEYKK